MKYVPYFAQLRLVAKIAVIVSVLVSLFSSCSQSAITTPEIEKQIAPPSSPINEKPVIQEDSPTPTSKILSIESLNYYAFNYQEYDASEHNDLGGNYDGWKIGIGQIYYVNETSQPVSPGKLMIVKGEVETVEGIKYPAMLHYPAQDFELAPGLNEDNRLQLAKGNIVWDKQIPLSIGNVFPIPPNFPIRIMGMNYFGFRFAEAAHPTTLKLTTENQTEIKIDLTHAEAAVPEPNDNLVNSSPLSEFVSQLSQSNDKYNFQFIGNCLIRDGLNKPVVLPFNVENKDQFNELKLELELNYIVYTPGGFVEDWDSPLILTIGPGQTKQGELSIELIMTSYELGAPSYFIFIDKAGNQFPYKLECTSE